jgi:hypothetical protein
VNPLSFVCFEKCGPVAFLGKSRVVVFFENCLFWKVETRCLLSCFVMFCPVLSWPLMFCPVMFCLVLSCRFMFCYVVSCSVLFCPVPLCSVMSCRVLFCQRGTGPLSFLESPGPLSFLEGLLSFWKVRACCLFWNVWWACCRFSKSRPVVFFGRCGPVIVLESPDPLSFYKVRVRCRFGKSGHVVLCIYFLNSIFQQNGV